MKIVVQLTVVAIISCLAGSAYAGKCYSQWSAEMDRCYKKTNEAYRSCKANADRRFQNCKDPQGEMKRTPSDAVDNSNRR